MDPEDLEAKFRWEDFKLLVSISPLNMNDYTDASRKFRNYPPRLSEPLIPLSDYFSRLSETSIEDPKKKMERYKLEANRAYDALIQMSERSTRSIRCNLYWKNVLFGGEQFY